MTQNQKNGHVESVPKQDCIDASILTASSSNERVPSKKGDSFYTGGDEDCRPSDDIRSAQCRTLLAALEIGPKGTADLIALGMLSPSKRIQECRSAGHRIDTVRMGRIGLYVLRQGGAA